jgi:CheY-like chemotaxis protein
VNDARILVVDDDNAIRETLRAILDDEGYRVTVARHGQEALEQIDAGLVPALCIVDLVMPVLNGWDLCAELSRRPALARVPVLLVSASSELDAALPAPETVELMKKPISFDRLLAYVDQHGRAARR